MSRAGGRPTEEGSEGVDVETETRRAGAAVCKTVRQGHFTS